MADRKTDELGRRKWDTAKYEAEARLRDYEEGGAATKPEKRVALERRPLQGRRETLPLEQNLGKVIAVSPTAPKSRQGGYWCSTCEVLVKDSLAWLDHVNGKRHNRLHGNVMRVERADVAAVKERLQSLKAAKEQGGKITCSTEAASSVVVRLEKLAEKAALRREERRRRETAKKTAAAAPTSGDQGVLDDEGGGGYVAGGETVEAAN